MSERLLGGAGATVDSVPELGAAQASRAAAANPMMWGDFTGVPPSLKRGFFNLNDAPTVGSLTPPYQHSAILLRFFVHGLLLMMDGWWLVAE